MRRPTAGAQPGLPLGAWHSSANLSESLALECQPVSPSASKTASVNSLLTRPLAPLPAARGSTANTSKKSKLGNGGRGGNKRKWSTMSGRDRTVASATAKAKNLLWEQTVAAEQAAAAIAPTPTAAAAEVAAEADIR